jgi:hypothetical protein
MMLALAITLLLLPLQSPAPTLAGAWEGSSLCTVPNSPCHDEHVVYHIKAAEAKDPTKFAIDANKIVNGAEESMGTLQCTFTPRKNELYCDTVGDWRFTVTGNTMSGTLNLKDGTLYRRVNLKKIEEHSLNRKADRSN